MLTQPSSLAELVVREVTGGQLNIAEQQQIRSWIEENPAHARMLSSLRDAQWRMREWQHYKDVDKQAVWTRMQSRAAAMPDQPPLPELEHAEWRGAGPPAGVIDAAAGAGDMRAGNAEAGTPIAEAVPSRRAGRESRTMRIWALMVAIIFFP